MTAWSMSIRLRWQFYYLGVTQKLRYLPTIFSWEKDTQPQWVCRTVTSNMPGNVHQWPVTTRLVKCMHLEIKNLRHKVAT